MDYISQIRAHVGRRQLLIPSVSAIVRDDLGRVLLCRKTDERWWGLVGGAIEPGETPAEAVVREANEETGLLVKPAHVIGVYGGPDFFVSYPNGDEVAYISTAFLCERVGGRLQPDGDEIAELRYLSARDTASVDLTRIASVVLPDVLRASPAAAFQPFESTT